jgi:hypothetical protein
MRVLLSTCGSRGGVEPLALPDHGDRELVP